MASSETVFDPQTWGLFEDDATRSVAAIEDALLRLESGSPELDAQLRLVLHELHTLKGNAGSLGLVSVNRLCHAAEDLIMRIDGGGVSPDGPVVGLLLQVPDRLREILADSANGPRTEHLAQVAPLIRDLESSGAPSALELPDLASTSRMSLSEARDLASRVQTAFLASLGPDDDGAYEPTEAMHAALSALHRIADCTGQEVYRQAVERLLELVPAGRPDVLRLASRLAHRELEASANGGSVLFDVPSAPPPLDDASLAWPFVRVVDRVISRTPESIRETSREGELRQLVVLCEAIEPDPGAFRKAASAIASASNGGSPDDLDSALAQLREATSALRDTLPDPNSSPPTADPGRTTPFIRVRLCRVDDLMAVAGELGLAVGGLLELPAMQSIAQDQDVQSAVRRLEGLVRRARDGSSNLRLVPLSTAFQPMKRLVRDLGERTGKSIVLRTLGGDTELDKVVVQALGRPLVHLVRNAVDHGLEMPAERVAAGKPESGEIRIAGRQLGHSVEVTVEDDGRGLSRERILRRAISAGLVPEDTTDSMSDRAVWDLIFRSGFSTSEVVSDISGRGMGMDVVRKEVQDLRGRVLIDSVPGAGTAIRLVLPLTLAFLDGLVVRVADRCYVIPGDVVDRVFRVTAEDLSWLEPDRMVVVRVGEHHVPGLCLPRFYAGKDGTIDDFSGRTLVVVKTASTRIAIPVDTILGYQSVAITPPTWLLADIRGNSGFGLLRTGEVALVLNCDQLAARVS